MSDATTEFSLEKLAEQEKTLRLRSFTNDDALSLGLALCDRAKELSLPVTIRIESAGQCLFHHALEGTSTDNDRWAAGKIKTATYFHHSSLYVSRLMQSTSRSAADHALDPEVYRISGGAFPLVMEKGGFVGAVAVSGLPDHEDHRLVVDVLYAWIENRRGRST